MNHDEHRLNVALVCGRCRRVVEFLFSVPATCATTFQTMMLTEPLRDHAHASPECMGWPVEISSSPVTPHLYQHVRQLSGAGQ